MDQLREERDEALALLQRVEASRNDLARQQGQYKGRIAKVMFSPDLLRQRNNTAIQLNFHMEESLRRYMHTLDCAPNLEQRLEVVAIVAAGRSNHFHRKAHPGTESGPCGAKGQIAAFLHSSTCCV